MKSLKMNSLRKKISFFIVVLFLVIFSIMYLFLVQNNMRATRESITQEARAYASLSTKPIIETYDLYYNSGYFKFKEVMMTTLNLSPSIRKIHIVDMNGEVIFDSDELKTDDHQLSQVNSDYLEAIKGDQRVEIADPQNSQQILSIIEPYFDAWGAHRNTVIYDVSYGLVSQNAARLGNIIILLTVTFLVLGIATTYTVVNLVVVRPIEIVQQGAKKVSAGNYDYKIEVHSQDEIEALADSTNAMARTLLADIEKLKEVDKLKDEFIDIAAHHFRTPITHIRFDIDYLRSKGTGKFSTKELDILKDIEVSNENLTLLIEDLFNITTLEKGKMKLVKFQPFDLGIILKQALSIFRQKAKDKDISMKVYQFKQEHLNVLGDPPKIREAISNVLDNAVKFTPAGGSVTVNLEDHLYDYLISVEDNGIGISEQELPKIFTKFHRGTDTYTYDYSGRGLGLYITKLIIEAHNGKIWVESKVGKGSKFYLSLPKNMPGSPEPHHIGSINGE